MTRVKVMPDWLAHHGILGQKWGVKNGPPYPIGSGPKGGSYLGKNLPANYTMDQRQEYLKSLQASMDTWTYGVKVGGKTITDGDAIDQVMQSGEYRIGKPEDLEKSKTGVCWDYTAYADKALYENGIPHRNIFWQNGKTGQTHTFTLLSGDGNPMEISKNLLWMESAWESHKGLHKVNSVKDVISTLNKEYNVPWPQSFNAYTYDYPARNWTGLTADQFINKMYVNGGQFVV